MRTFLVGRARPSRLMLHLTKGYPIGNAVSTSTWTNDGWLSHRQHTCDGGGTNGFMLAETFHVVLCHARLLIKPQ